MKLEHRPSQEDRILELLAARGDSWTPAPELANISLQYCARINSLRRRGHRIDNHTEMHGGAKHGFYRLVPVGTTPSLFAGGSQ